MWIYTWRSDFMYF